MLGKTRQLVILLWTFALVAIALTGTAYSQPTDAPTKAAYIEKMDARCAELKEIHKADNAKFEKQIVSNPRAALKTFNKLTDANRKDNEAMAKEIRPTEGAADLEKFWKEVANSVAILGEEKVHFKRLIVASEKAKKAKGAQKQLAITEVKAVAKKFERADKRYDRAWAKIEKIANSYGFKKCGIRSERWDEA